MALSFDTYAGDGVTTNFSVSYPYISNTHVAVYLDGVLKTITTDYTWFNATTIQFVVAPAAAVVIRIDRETTNTERLVDFQDAGNLTEADLDANSNQVFYLVQETLDGFEEKAMQLASDDKWDAETKVIKNVVDPTDDQDAATKKFADDLWAANLATVAAAVADTAADVVTTNADVVLTNADVVTTNADVVLTNADAASTAQDSIDTNADLLATNQDTLDTAADLVLTNADVVLTHADVVLTNADAASTAQDSIDTNADLLATNADLVATNQDTIDTAADLVATNQDTIDTAADLVETAADVIASAASAAAAAASAASVDSNLMNNRRNLIINGNMAIAQRETSTAAAGNGDYTLDRWKFRKTGGVTGVVTVAQVASVAAGLPFRHHMKITVTTADTAIPAADWCVINQTIEGVNTDHLEMGTAGAQTVTLSFWHAHTKTGTQSIAMRNAAYDRTWVGEYTQTAADTWEESEVTLTLDTTGTWGTGTSAGIEIGFCIAQGTDSDGTVGWNAGSLHGTNASANNLDSTANKMRFANVQFEEGIVKTTYDRRLFSEDMDACQRYFQKSWNYSSAVGTANDVGISTLRLESSGTKCYGLQRDLRTRMKSTPTVTWYSNNNGTAGKVYNLTDTTSRSIGATQDESQCSTGTPIFDTSQDISDKIEAHWTCESEF